jgi:hypothetical protein
MSFDLSGLLHVQRAYVGNLGNASALTAIQSTLGNLNATYSTSFSNSQGLLTQQTSLNDILNREKTRLDAKKTLVDDEIAGRKRIVDLNESYRKKQAQYVYIIIVLIFALLLYIMIIKIKTFIPLIPDSVVDLLTFFLGALTCLYLYILIKDIYSRDNMNYDQLNLAAPITATDEETLQKQKSAALTGDLLGSIANPNTCVGESCCVANVSVYEPGIGKCIKDCKTLEPTVGSLYNTTTKSCQANLLSSDVGIYKICGRAIIPKATICFNIDGFTTLTKPYTPSEYENYSLI